MYYYFSASVKGLKDNIDIYKKIITILDGTGATALNYVHLPDKNPEKLRIESEIRKGKTTAYSIQTSLIDKADFLVVYLFKETVTIGYQIEYAIRKKIPVLVIIPEENRELIPVMLTDNHVGLLSLEFYNGIGQIEKIIKRFLSSLESGRIKFNFFINIPISNYLNQRAEKENKPKSELVREILLDEINRNPLHI